MKLKADTYRNTLIEQVTNLLEKSIVTGKILPGERLTEARLAQQLGVSKAPVREALIRLEELGLLRKTHRGREVVRFSLDELLDLMEIKRLIEVYATTKGSKIASAQTINRLKKLVDKMGELLAPSNYSKLRGVNHLFHNLLVESAGNKKLYEIYLHVVKHIRWTTHLSLGRPGRLELSNKEHREIFTAFAKADEKNLQILIEEHSYRLQEQLVEAKKREKSTEIL